MLLLGLTDVEADFSDSEERKRSGLIRGRTDWELHSQGHEDESRGPVSARVLYHCLASPIRFFQLEYKFCPSLLRRTTAEALLYN